uniref:ACT domain-containing protein n=1 Tax=Schlesneria paludicola TaxID=360056 RepID=A0A7C4QMW4_9PLAN
MRLVSVIAAAHRRQVAAAARRRKSRGQFLYYNASKLLEARSAGVAKQYVLTVMAANRVGILAALSNALDELRGSFVDVNQAVMRQYFTIIMSAEFPDDRQPEVIVDHIRDVCRPFGVEVMLQDPQADAVVESLGDRPPSQQYLLRLAGTDRPGVLRRVSHRLAQDGIDVIDLYGERQDQFGTFTSCLQLDVPQGVDVATLHRDLDQMLRPEGIAVSLFHDRVLQAISHPESPLSQRRGSFR